MNATIAIVSGPQPGNRPQRPAGRTPEAGRQAAPPHLPPQPTRRGQLRTIREILPEVLGQYHLALPDQ